MTTRRLLATAIAGALAVAGLAGCRSDPGVAAYIGNEQITEAEVDDVLAELPRLVQAHNRARAAAQPDQIKDDSPLSFEAAEPSRDTVVSTMVFLEVCRQAGAAAQTTEAGATFQVAKAEGLPVDARYVQERVRYYACLRSLGGNAQPVTPTEAQLRDLYVRGVAAKVFPPDQTFDMLADQLAANDQVRGAFGLRKALLEKIEERDVTVNPRYRPLEVPVLSFSQSETAVGVPLSPVDAEPAVHDAG